MTYSEMPASSIRYTVEWKITTSERSKSNKKILARNTEQNVVLSPTTFWNFILRTKLKKALKKIPPSRQFTAEDTNVVVSVNDRSERDLVKQYDGTKIEWMAIENQLLAWGELFHRGKKLRVNLALHFVVSGPEPAPARRGRQSATTRMLTELDEQAERDQTSGRPAVWQGVYQLMRCPGPPCHLGPHCWRDSAGKKHYRLMTHQPKRLVQYKEDGNKLDSHDDVPEDVRQELYATEQQRLERQQQATKGLTKSLPSIQITNVLLGQAWCR